MVLPTKRLEVNSKVEGQFSCRTRTVTIELKLHCVHTCVAIRVAVINHLHVYTRNKRIYYF